MKKVAALLVALAFSNASHALTGPQQLGVGLLIAGGIGGIVAAATSGTSGTQ